MLNEKQIKAHALALMPTMQSMFRALCRSEAEAEDELNQAYIYLTTYLVPAYEGGSNIKTFCQTALRRKFYNHRAKHYHSRRGGLKVIDEDGDQPQGMDSVMDDSPTAFARLFTAQRLRNALAVLTADERALCEAFIKYGEWHRAAEAIGVSGVKASRMLKRIKAKVAK